MSSTKSVASSRACVFLLNGSATNQQRSAFIDGLKSHEIAITKETFDEIDDAYKETASDIRSHSPKIISLEDIHYVEAGRLDDLTKKPFSLSPYDSQSDTCSLAYASVENLTFIGTDRDFRKLDKATEAADVLNVNDFPIT